MLDLLVYDLVTCRILECVTSPTSTQRQRQSNSCTMKIWLQTDRRTTFIFQWLAFILFLCHYKSHFSITIYFFCLINLSELATRSSPRCKDEENKSNEIKLLCPTDFVWEDFLLFSCCFFFHHIWRVRYLAREMFFV